MQTNKSDQDQPRPGEYEKPESWTWKQLAVIHLVELGPTGTSLQALYARLERHAKAQGRAHWKARLRAALQGSSMFVRVDRGVWALANRFSDEEVQRMNQARREQHPPLGPRTNKDSV